MTIPPAHGAVQTAASPDAVTLAPRPWLPLWILALAGLAQVLLPPWEGLPWISGITGLFGLFLLLQTALLRLRFGPEALQVLRLEQEIRRFPYADWSHWRLFWTPVPVLFYFREIRSLHLLPMLFDGRELRRQLELRVPLSSSDASP
jgi:Protein of unknown function (DUF3119)